MRLTIPEWICYLNEKVISIDSKSSLLYGDGSPPQSLGTNGDLYLRFNGGFLYKKEGNIWFSQGKIQVDTVDGGEVL